MRKLEQHPKRVLARALATEELMDISGSVGGVTWTDGTPRQDLTNVDAGDVAGSPPPA